MKKRRSSLVALAALSTFAFGLRAQEAEVETEVAAPLFQACYLPKTGLVYLIGLPDLPEECMGEDHVAVRLAAITSGAAATARLARGSVTTREILNRTILAQDLADASVTFRQIRDGTIRAEDLAEQYLLADGVRNTTDGFAVTGTFATGVIPTTGAGTRLMWYPGKAAFRVGEVSADQWNNPNVGRWSTAMA